MKSAIIRKNKSPELVFLPAGCILFTLILFYFDEGRHSLKGILDTGNIMGLALYFITMLGLTFAVYHILRRFLGITVAGGLAVLIGPPSGVALILGIFMFLS